MKPSPSLWQKDFAAALLAVFALVLVYALLTGKGLAGVPMTFVAPFVFAVQVMSVFFSTSGTTQDLILPIYILVLFALAFAFMRAKATLSRAVLWGLWVLAWSSVCIIAQSLLNHS